MVSNLVVGCIEKYQAAKQIISRYLKLEAKQKNSHFFDREQEQKEDNWETKQSRHDKRTILSMPNLPQLTVLISQIYQSTKEYGYWKQQPSLRIFPEKRNTNKYYNYHKDHGHCPKDCQALKNFILKLIDDGHLKEFIQHQ